MSTVSVPLQRLKVASTILFHSISAIAVTLVSKSALNQLDAPVTLLFFQTAVQTLLVTVVGRLFGCIRWISWFVIGICRQSGYDCVTLFC